MSEALSQLLGHSALFVLLAAIGVVLARFKVRAGWLAIAFGLFILQDMALSQGWGAFEFDLVDSAWNWEGTILSVVVLLILAVALFSDRWPVTGLRFKQDGPAPLTALAVALALCAALAGAAYWMVPGKAGQGVEDLFFHAALPGLEEEIFYRGLLLGALDKAFGTPLRVLRAPVGWAAVMSAMLFATAHSITLTPQLAMVMDVAQGAWLFPAGLVLAWLRNATGSILLPVAVHSWANAAFYVI